jgi:hypothetical protein
VATIARPLRTTENDTHAASLNGLRQEWSEHWSRRKPNLSFSEGIPTVYAGKVLSVSSGNGLTGARRELLGPGARKRGKPKRADVLKREPEAVSLVLPSPSPELQQGKGHRARERISEAFELEPEQDPCDHEHVSLPDGWQELVSEAGFCDSCSEVVWIRLRQPS